MSRRVAHLDLRALALLPLLAVLHVGAGCSRDSAPREGVYVAQKNGTEQRFVLKPDGSFLFQGPSGETKGTYTRGADKVEIITDKGVHASLTADKDDLVDQGGIRWTKK